MSRVDDERQPSALFPISPTILDEAFSVVAGGDIDAEVMRIVDGDGNPAVQAVIAAVATKYNWPNPDKEMPVQVLFTIAGAVAIHLPLRLQAEQQGIPLVFAGVDSFSALLRDLGRQPETRSIARYIQEAKRNMRSVDAGLHKYFGRILNDGREKAPPNLKRLGPFYLTVGADVMFRSIIKPLQAQELQDMVGPSE